LRTVPVCCWEQAEDLVALRVPEQLIIVEDFTAVGLAGDQVDPGWSHMHRIVIADPGQKWVRICEGSWPRDLFQHIDR